MRAALLPTPGDPFVVSYWLKNFTRVWPDEVDELHVLVNGGDPFLLQPMFDRAADAKKSGRVVVSYEHDRVGHGEALARLLEECSADEVVLVEDDAYVRRPGAIHTAFEWRRPVPGVVLGSPRGGYSPELEPVAMARWGPSVGPDTSSGHGLWPCFLFADRADLLAVVSGFPSQTWRAGETIPGIDFLCEREMHTDTFSAAAFMLRDTRPVLPVPQHKEIWLKPRIVADRAPWFHAGGLSNLDPRSGFVGLKTTVEGNEALDWASRYWWWRRCVETQEGLDDLVDDYRRHLDALEVSVPREQVEYWNDLYPSCITWNDDGKETG